MRNEPTTNRKTENKQAERNTERLAYLRILLERTMNMQEKYAPIKNHTNMKMYVLGNSDVLMEEIILRKEIAELT